MDQPQKVLIIDDDPIVLETTSTWLREEGYDVITHDNAMGSSRIVLRERPNYVLVDIMMPGMSGDELVKMLTEHVLVDDPDIKFFLYSSKVKMILDSCVHNSKAHGSIQKTHNVATFLEDFRALAK